MNRFKKALLAVTLAASAIVGLGPVAAHAVYYTPVEETEVPGKSSCTIQKVSALTTQGFIATGCSG